MHGLLWGLTENIMVTTTLPDLVMRQPCAFIFHLYDKPMSWMEVLYWKDL